MAFTTVAGARGAADSFLGTNGVDAITLGVLANGAWLGARQANDVIAFNSGSSSTASAYTLNGGAGNDSFTSQAATSFSRSQLLGDTGNDTFTLTGAANSTISAGQGDDQVTTAGLLSSSLLNGNQGEDQLSVNAGVDSSRIFGGLADDTITVTTGLSSSVVQGNEGADVFTIANGTSVSGSTVNGNQGNDTITVNAIAAFATSTLFGGDGNDTINTANATVGIVARGDAGNDQLTGGTAADSLTAGDGTDIITGGLGADNLTGGNGADRYVYATSEPGQLTGGTAGSATLTTTFGKQSDPGDITPTETVTATLTYVVDGITRTATFTATPGFGATISQIQMYEGLANAINAPGSGSGVSASAAATTSDGLTLSAPTGTTVSITSIGYTGLAGNLAGTPGGGGAATAASLSDIDIITDFAFGTDAIDPVNNYEAGTRIGSGTTATAMTGTTLVTAIQSLYTRGGALAGADTFGLFSYGGRTYLAGNNTAVTNAATQGFSQADNDLLIDVTGFTGTLSATTFIA